MSLLGSVPEVERDGGLSRPFAIRVTPITSGTRRERKSSGSDTIARRLIVASLSRLTALHAHVRAPGSWEGLVQGRDSGFARWPPRPGSSDNTGKSTPTPFARNLRR